MTFRARLASILILTLSATTFIFSGPSILSAYATGYRGLKMNLPLSGGIMRADSDSPISMVGVSWHGDAPQRPVRLRFETDGRWTQWRDLDRSELDGPDGVSDLKETDPLWIGSASSVQVDVPSGLAGARLHLVHESGTVRLGTSVAQAAVDDPSIHPRSDWGARAPSVTPSYASSLKMGFIHHTDTSSNSYSMDEVPGILRAIQAYHMDTRGWNDIGYNFLVDRFGRLWEGREGGMDKTVIGAHAQGFNTGSTGVSVIGTFTTVAPSTEAIEGLKKLFAWKLPLHGVDPAGQVQMTSGGSPKYPDGTQVVLKTISGHRDTGETECPGDGLYPLIDSIRRDAAALGASFIPYPNFGGGIFNAAGDLDLDGMDEVITGADASGGPNVKVFTASGTATASFYAYDPRFTGGVRVAAGNVDNVPGDEIITGPGRDGGPHVRMFKMDGTALSWGFYAYDPNFTGGIYVASGNTDGLPGDEIITSPGRGGGPHIKVFKKDGTQLASFYAYDPNFTGGVRVAAADMDGVPGDEIITSPGPGGGPHIKVWRLTANGYQEMANFYAYDPNFTGGVYVAGMKMADGTHRLITGAGEAGGPHVRIFDKNATLMSEFFFLRPDLIHGVRVSAGHFDANAEDSLALSGGASSFPLLRLERANGAILPVGSTS